MHVSYRLSFHAKKKAREQNIPEAAILASANHPTVTYENGRFPGQWRHVRDGLVATVDPEKQTIVTFYQNVVETPLRSDQTDAAALAYAQRDKQIA